MCRFTRIFASLVVLAPLVACAPPQPSQVKADGNEKAEDVAVGEPTPPAGKILSVGDDVSKAVGGQSFDTTPPRPAANQRDPAWFRATLFADAELLKQGRAPAEEDGLFASQITVALAEGTTLDACVDHLMEAVGAEVSGLEIEDQGDRRSITGATAHYSVLLLCGEAKGRMTAYLSYRWTSLPSGS